MLAGFGNSYGLDRDTALKLGRSFGAGMGMGNMCGAITGALMVLGLASGAVTDNERQLRYRCYEKVRELVGRFEEKHGTTVCRELLGVDVGNEAGRKEALQRGLFTELCPRFVEDAVSFLESLLGTP